MTDSLNKKYFDSITLTAIASLTTGATAFAPTPGVEALKQILAVSAADATVFMQIYHIFMKDESANMEVGDMMAALGGVALLGGGAGYLALKFLQGLVDEVANLAGPSGWILSGMMSAFTTFVLGIAWTALLYEICLQGLLNQQQQVV